MLRNPCAVVHSRMRLQWDPELELASLLGQPDLVTDHLKEKMHVIEGCTSAVARHALVWCISNLVPLHQLSAVSPLSVFYEDLYADSETELGRVFRLLGLPTATVERRRVSNASTTTHPDSAVLSGTSTLTDWCTQLAPADVATILGVVDAFGLGHLYGASHLPIGSMSHVTGSAASERRPQ
jgi:hypothetical protein